MARFAKANNERSEAIEEYQQTDRLVFERVVAECFGYSEHFDKIKNCVLEMQKVRLSVR